VTYKTLNLTKDAGYTTQDQASGMPKRDCANGAVFGCFINHQRLKSTESTVHLNNQQEEALSGHSITKI